MLNRLLILLAFCIILLIYLPVHSPAQWIQTNGPYGGEVRSLALKGATVLAASNWVYVSSNNGTNWEKKSIDLPPASPLAVAIKDTVFFASFPGYGIFRSIDHGATWDEANNGLTASHIFAFASDDSSIFAGGGPVFKSTNHGASWAAIDSGFPAIGVRSLVVKDSLIWAGTFGSGVFRTTNYGVSWTALNSGLPSNYVLALAAKDSQLYAGTFGGIFRMSFQDTMWSSSLPMDTSVISMAVSMDRILAATNLLGILSSSNNGASWNVRNLGLSDLMTQALAADSNNVYVGTTSNGVFKSTNLDASWEHISTGLEFAGVVSLLAWKGGFLAGSYGNVYSSTNNGAHWLPSDARLNGSIVYALEQHDQTLFAGGNGKGVSRSLDSGKTWTSTNSGLSSLVIRALVNHQGTLFAATDSGLYMTTNQGSDWNPSYLGQPFRFANALASAQELLYAATDQGVFRSTNNGSSWIAINNGLDEPTSIGLLAANAATIFAAVTCCVGGGVFVSTDSGSTWGAANTGLSNLNIRAFAFSQNFTLAATDGDGVFISPSNGSQWYSITSNLPPGPILDLDTNDSTLLAATTSGVWIRPLSDVLSNVSAALLNRPEDFSLHQNYPNPFNPSTSISFTVAARTHLRITVFDYLGRKIAVPFDGPVIPGTHTIPFNSMGYSSGVYFYRLESGQVALTRAMILVK